MNNAKANGTGLIITGTGRCGTGYVSTVFKEIGVPVGHEQIFTPDGIMQYKEFVGDSSWLAVPHLPVERMITIHLVRNTLRCLNSLLAQKGLWEEPYNDWGLWVHEQLPILNQLVDPRDKVAEFYCTWNNSIRGDLLWRVEDLEVSDFITVAIELGYNLQELDANAFNRVPKNVNARSVEPKSWDFWDKTRHGQLLHSFARKYGYEKS